MNVLQEIGAFLGQKMKWLYNLIDNHKKDFKNPHRVDKEQVGLGNVDNTSGTDKPVSELQRDAMNELYRDIRENFQTLTGDTEKNTVTFTEAEERVNIESGETHSTLFGKIRKWFADLGSLAFRDELEDLNVMYEDGVSTRYNGNEPQNIYIPSPGKRIIPRANQGRSHGEEGFNELKFNYNSFEVKEGEPLYIYPFLVGFEGMDISLVTLNKVFYDDIDKRWMVLSSEYFNDPPYERSYYSVDKSMKGYYRWKIEADGKEYISDNFFLTVLSMRNIKEIINIGSWVTVIDENVTDTIQVVHRINNFSAEQVNLYIVTNDGEELCDEVQVFDGKYLRRTFHANEVGEYKYKITVDGEEVSSDIFEVVLYEKILTGEYVKDAQISCNPEKKLEFKVNYHSLDDGSFRETASLIPEASDKGNGLMSLEDKSRLKQLFDGSMLDTNNPVGYHKHNYLEMADLPPVIEMPVNSYESFKSVLAKLQTQVADGKYGRIIQTGDIKVTDDDIHDLQGIEFIRLSGTIQIDDFPLHLSGYCTLKSVLFSCDSRRSSSNWADNKKAIVFHVSRYQKLRLETVDFRGCFATTGVPTTPVIEVINNGYEGYVEIKGATLHNNAGHSICDKGLLIESASNKRFTLLLQECQSIQNYLGMSNVVTINTGYTNFLSDLFINDGSYVTPGGTPKNIFLPFSKTKIDGIVPAPGAEQANDKHILCGDGLWRARETSYNITGKVNDTGPTMGTVYDITFSESDTATLLELAEKARDTHFFPSVCLCMTYISDMYWSFIIDKCFQYQNDIVFYVNQATYPKNGGGGSVFISIAVNLNKRTVTGTYYSKDLQTQNQ